MNIYLSHDTAQLPKGLRCERCDWRPPRGWSRQKKSVYGKVSPQAYWRALAQQHQRVMHEKHEMNCLCVTCMLPQSETRNHTAICQCTQCVD